MAAGQPCLFFSTVPESLAGESVTVDNPALELHMVIVLVHWLIQPGKEEEFKDRWKQMTIGRESGLYREILTELDREPPNPKFHTFSLGDPFYSTFVNIGIWESVEAFDRAVGKYIPEPEIVEKDGKQKYLIELEGFEFKLRERAVLKVLFDRGGQLPEAQLEN